MKTNILTYPEAVVPADLRMQVLALQRAAWPGIDEPFFPQMVHDPVLHPVSMLLVIDRQVLAALDILSKDIIHQNERYFVSGLSCVVTDQQERKKGYGRQLVCAAQNMMRENGADLSIFTCDPSLQYYYERCGCQALIDAPLIGGTPDQPFPSDQFNKVTMVHFFSEKAVQHAHTFNHTRIALYPGMIDKLW